MTKHAVFAIDRVRDPETGVRAAGMAEEDPIALVRYYVRLGHGQHALSVCTRYLDSAPHDPLLRFWHVYAMIIAACPATDILPELNALKEQSELRLAALVAELRLREGDKVGLQLVHSLLESEQRCASQDAFLLAAEVAWLLADKHNLERAERFASGQPQCINAKCLSAWILLATKRQAACTAAIQSFDDVLAVSRKNLDALLGKAACYELIGDYDKAVRELNLLTASHPWFYPAISERGRMALMMQDWDLMFQAAEELLGNDTENIDALRLKVHFLICKENDMTCAASTLGDLTTSLEKTEPKNGRLYLEFAKPIARLAGRAAPNVLNKTLSLVERSQKMDPDDGNYLLELADQFFLLGDYTAAMSSYRLASQMESVQADAFYGVIQCLLIMGAITEAEDCLRKLPEPEKKSAFLAYLNAQLSWLTNSSYSKCRDLLSQTIDLHMEAIRERSGYDYYAELNPELLLGVAQLWLSLHRYGVADIGLSKPMGALRLLISAVPAFVNAHVVLAYMHFDVGDLEASQNSVERALSHDSTCSTAYMLLAQIRWEQGDADAAKEYLEHAAADDFIIRESLQYYMLRAKLLIHERALERALLVLESALALPCMNPLFDLRRLYYVTGCRLYLSANHSDRAMLHSLLASIHLQMRNYPEATRIIEEAKRVFAGTAEEAQVLIASSGLLVAKGEIETALGLLQQVPCDSSYFKEAKLATAAVYLRLHDKVNFISCHSQLAELFPTAKTHIMLGDALLKVDEPSRALKPYQAALKDNPQDTCVIRKFGKALISSHEYDRAVEHFESSLLSLEEGSGLINLHHDLAELCIKLKHFTRAERAAREAVTRAEHFFVDPSKLLLKCLLVLLEAQSCLGKYSPALESIVKLKGYLRQSVAAQRESYLTDFCIQFSQVCERQKDSETAVSFLREASRSARGSVPALVELARLHLQRGEVSESEVSCAAALKSEPSNMEGAKLLINILVQRELHDAALLHFQEFLHREPSCYPVLAQFITFLRRLGRLEEAEPYIQRAEKASPVDAGLSYCKGLWARYSNNRYEAVQLLNAARADEGWKRRAIHAMVDIYMNMDEELLCEEEVFGAATNLDAEEVYSVTQLLSECKSSSDSRILSWECYAQMTSGQRIDVEMALARLNEIASKEKDEVFTMLCIAVAHHLLKQAGKAKAQLRVIDRLTYKWEEGEIFERTWLMLASMHIQAGKLDVAEQLCKKCLKYNKSSSRAWEWLGLIMEKSHTYNEAANLYESAWKYRQGSTSLSTGYKLAFAYLKSRKFSEAIGVCREVLEFCPNNSKVQRDILDKARKSLRA